MFFPYKNLTGLQNTEKLQEFSSGWNIGKTQENSYMKDLFAFSDFHRNFVVFQFSNALSPYLYLYSLVIGIVSKD